MSELFEPHPCSIDARQAIDSWAEGCVICDIEMMRVRVFAGWEVGEIVRGDDWVMLAPPRPFPVDADGFFRFK